MSVLHGHNCESMDLYNARKLQKHQAKQEQRLCHAQNSPENQPKLPVKAEAAIFSNHIENQSKSLPSSQNESLHKQTKLHRLKHNTCIRKHNQLMGRENNGFNHAGSCNEQTGNLGPVATELKRLREYQNVNENKKKHCMPELVKELQTRSRISNFISTSGNKKRSQRFQRFLCVVKTQRITKRKSGQTKSDQSKHLPKQRCCLMSKGDKNYLRAQLAIWFPCIFRRPMLKRFQKALVRVRNSVFRNLFRVKVMKRNQKLTETKAERRLFRKEQLCDRMSKNKAVHYVSTVIPKHHRHPTVSQSDAVTRAPLTSFKDNRLSGNYSTLEFQKGISTKEGKCSFINAERHWRHDLMFSDNEPSSKVILQQDACTDREFQESSLNTTAPKPNRVPEWFLAMVRKNVAINIHPFGLNDATETSPEIKQLTECQRRIIIGCFPGGEGIYSAGDRIYVSVLEQENACKHPNTVPCRTHSAPRDKLVNSFELSKIKHIRSSLHSSLRETTCLSTGDHSCKCSNQEVEDRTYKSPHKRSLPAPKLSVRSTVNITEVIQSNKDNHRVCKTGAFLDTYSQNSNAGGNLNKNEDLNKVQLQDRWRTVKKSLTKLRQLKTDSSSIVRRIMPNSLEYKIPEGFEVSENSSKQHRLFREEKHVARFDKKERRKQKIVRFVGEISDSLNISNSSLHKINEVFECCDEILVDNISGLQELVTTHVCGPIISKQDKNINIEECASAIKSSKIIFSNDKPSKEFSQTEINGKLSPHSSVEHMNLNKAGRNDDFRYIRDKVKKKLRNISNHKYSNDVCNSSYSKIYKKNCRTARDCAMFRCSNRQRASPNFQIPAPPSSPNFQISTPPYDLTSILLKETEETLKKNAYMLERKQSLFDFVKTQWRSDDVSSSNSKTLHQALIPACMVATKKQTTEPVDLKQSQCNTSEHTKHCFHDEMNLLCGKDKEVPSIFDKDQSYVRPVQSYETMCEERRKNYEEVCRTINKYYDSVSQENVDAVSSQLEMLEKQEDKRKSGISEIITHNTPLLADQAKSNTQAPLTTEWRNHTSVYEKSNDSAMTPLYDLVYKSSFLNTSPSETSSNLSASNEHQLFQSPKAFSFPASLPLFTVAKQTQTSPPNLTHSPIKQPILGLPDSQTELLMANIRSCNTIKVENHGELFLTLLVIDKLLVSFIQAIDALSKYLMSTYSSAGIYGKQSRNYSKNVNAEQDSGPRMKEPMSPRNQSKRNSNRPISSYPACDKHPPTDIKYNQYIPYMAQNCSVNRADSPPSVKSDHSPGKKKVIEGQSRKPSKNTGRAKVGATPINEESEEISSHAIGSLNKSEEILQVAHSLPRSVSPKNESPPRTGIESTLVKEYMSSFPELPSRISLTTHGAIEEQKSAAISSNLSTKASVQDQSQTHRYGSDHVSSRHHLYTFDDPSTTSSPRKDVVTQSASFKPHSLQKINSMGAYPHSVTSRNYESKNVSKISPNYILNEDYSPKLNSSQFASPSLAAPSDYGFSDRQNQSQFETTQIPCNCPMINRLNDNPEDYPTRGTSGLFSGEISPAQQLFRDVCWKIKTNCEESLNKKQTACNGICKGNEGQIGNEFSDSPFHLNCRREVIHRHRLIDYNSDDVNDKQCQRNTQSNLRALEVDNRLLDPSKHYHDISLIEDLYRKELKKARLSVALQEYISSQLEQLQAVADEKIDPAKNKIVDDLMYFKHSVPFGKPETCTKSLQVEINPFACHKSEQAVKSRVLSKKEITNLHVDVAVQTCACINRPNRTCLCGYLNLQEKHDETSSSSSSGNEKGAKNKATLKSASSQNYTAVHDEKRVTQNDDSDSGSNEGKNTPLKQKLSPCHTKYRNKKCQIRCKPEFKIANASIGTSHLDGFLCENIPGSNNEYEIKTKTLKIPTASITTAANKAIEDGTYEEDMKCTEFELHDLLSEVFTMLATEEANCTPDQTIQPRQNSVVEKAFVRSDYTQTCNCDTILSAGNTGKSSQESSLVVAQLTGDIFDEEEFCGNNKRPIIRIRYRPRNSSNSPKEPVCGNSPGALNQQLSPSPGALNQQLSPSLGALNQQLCPSPGALNQQLKTELSGIIQNSRLLHQQAMQLRNKIKCANIQNGSSLNNSSQNTGDCRCEPSQWLDFQCYNKIDHECKDKNTNANSSSDQELSKGENSCVHADQRIGEIVTLSKSYCNDGSNCNSQRSLKKCCTKSDIINTNFTSNSQCNLTFNFLSRKNQWKIPSYLITNKQFPSPLQVISQQSKQLQKVPLMQGDFSESRSRQDKCLNAFSPTTEKFKTESILEQHKYTCPQNDLYFVNDPSEEAYLYINAHFPSISRSGVHHCSRQNLFKDRNLQNERKLNVSHRRAHTAVTSQKKTCCGESSRSMEIDSKEQAWDEVTNINVVHVTPTVSFDLAEPLNLCTKMNTLQDRGLNLSARAAILSQENEILPQNLSSKRKSTSHVKNYRQMLFNIGSLGQGGLKKTFQINNMQNDCCLSRTQKLHNALIHEKNASSNKDINNESIMNGSLKCMRSVGTMVSLRNWEHCQCYTPSGRDIVKGLRTSADESQARCPDNHDVYACRSESSQVSKMSETNGLLSSTSSTKFIDLVPSVSHCKNDKYLCKRTNSTLIPPYGGFPAEKCSALTRRGVRSAELRSSSVLSINIEESVSTNSNTKMHRHNISESSSMSRLHIEKRDRLVNHRNCRNYDTFHREKMPFIRKAETSAREQDNALQKQASTILQFENSNSAAFIKEQSNADTDMYMGCENNISLDTTMDESIHQAKLAFSKTLQLDAVNSQDSSHGIEDIPLDSVSLNGDVSNNDLRAGHKIYEKIRNGVTNVKYKSNLSPQQLRLISRSLPLSKQVMVHSADRNKVPFKKSLNSKINRVALTDIPLTQNSLTFQPLPGSDLKPEKLNNVTTFTKEFETSLPWNEVAEKMHKKVQYSGDTELVMWWNSPKFLKKMSILNDTLRHEPSSYLAHQKLSFNKFDNVNSTKESRLSPNKFGAQTNRCIDADSPIAKRDSRTNSYVFHAQNSSKDSTIKNVSNEWLENHGPKLENESQNSNETNVDITSQWHTCLLGCAEVIAVCDERVVVEGTYIGRSASPDSLHVLSNRQNDRSNESTAYKQGIVVKFRMTLSLNTDGDMDTVCGTYTRQLLTGDSFYKWSFVINSSD